MVNKQNSTNTETVQAKVQGNKIVIEIDIDGLKFASENRPDPVLVNDKDKLAHDVAKKITEFDVDETGIPAFCRLLEEIVDELYCDGVDYLAEWEPDNDVD